jgi:hypothetical protein
MATYYSVQVQFNIEDDRGKPKKMTYTYLVDAMSVTEAEVRMTIFLNNRGEQDFEVKAVSKSKIISVVDESEQLFIQD